MSLCFVPCRGLRVCQVIREGLTRLSEQLEKKTRAPGSAEAQLSRRGAAQSGYAVMSTGSAGSLFVCRSPNNGQRASKPNPTKDAGARGSRSQRTGRGSSRCPAANKGRRGRGNEGVVDGGAMLPRVVLFLDVGTAWVSWRDLRRGLRNERRRRWRQRSDGKGRNGQDGTKPRKRRRRGRGRMSVGELGQGGSRQLVVRGGGRAARATATATATARHCSTGDAVLQSGRELSGWRRGSGGRGGGGGDGEVCGERGEEDEEGCARVSSSPSTTWAERAGRPNDGGLICREGWPKATRRGSVSR
ncbi:hypothetical protein P154DRAFT_344875 [Amniculicola lignicola CBS 123094]|uniref:Uncharacterized protein n=1 Tax=Amniculicola lignicola CBS 123094 TaxID=1392246 RepID=A0A6A5W377_9PLEO|nr:hypothetical protein P154DRAFT_344875 [Amniculicola lignicola CBS 123094]